MNWLSNRLTDGFKKRIFKFVLKKALGRFIQELDLSQLDIQISSGVYSLNNVLIKTEEINQILQQLPITLKSGYIEAIKVTLPPLYRMLEANLELEISGIELIFTMKDSMTTDHLKKNILSSILTESLIGDRADPNVLASSILVGDVRKSDIDIEFDSSNRNEGLEAAEGVIGPLIERIVSSIKATITNATIRFECPSESEQCTQNVILFHCPRLDYVDETPMPTGSDTWQPSMFIYNFMFKGFVVQTFREEIDLTKSQMSASIFERKEGAENDERYLDEGNTIVYSEKENNSIRIKITTNETKKSNGNDIEVSLGLAAIHAVLMPKQLQILLEMIKALNCKLTPETPQSIAYELTPTLARAHMEKLRSIAADEDSTNFEDIDFGESSFAPNEQFTSVMGSTTSSKKVEEFRAVEEYDTDEDSFYSASSNDKEDKSEGEISPIGTKLADIQLSPRNSVFKIPSYTRDPTIAALEQYASPISFQIIVSLKGATFDLLYQDVSLTESWKKFMSNSLSRTDSVHAPMLPVDHLSLQCTKTTLKSVSNEQQTNVELCIGRINIIEKLLIGRKKRSARTSSADANIIGSNLSKSLLATRVVFDHFGERTEEKPTIVEDEQAEMFAEKKILEFLTRTSEHSRSDAPQIAMKSESNKDKNATIVRIRIDPVQVNLDLGIIGRIVNVIQNSTIPAEKDLAEGFIDSSITRSSDSTMQSELFVADLDDGYRTNKSMTTQVRAELQHIRIVFSFPILTNNVASKFDYLSDKLWLEADDLCISSERIRANAEEATINTTASVLRGYLLGKDQSRPQGPHVLISSDLKIEVTLRKVAPPVPTQKFNMDTDSKKKKRFESQETPTTGIYPPVYEPQDDEHFREVEMSHSIQSTISSTKHVDQKSFYEERDDLYTSSSDDEDSELEEDFEGSSTIFTRDHVSGVLSLYSSGGIVDQVVSDQKMFKSAAVAISISSTRLDMKMNKQQLDLFNQQIADITKHCTDPFAKLNVATYEQPVIEENRGFIENNGTADVAIKVSVEKAHAILDCIDQGHGKMIRVSLRNCTTHVTTLSQANLASTLQLRLQSNFVSLEETNAENRTRTILSRCNRLVKPYEKNSETALSVNMVTKHQPWDLTSQTQTSVTLQGINAHYYVDPPGDNAFTYLVKFFASDKVVPGTFINSFSITIRDSCIDYNPTTSNAHLLLLFDRLEVSTPTSTISTTDTSRQYIIPESNKFRFELYGLFAMLHNNFNDDIIKVLSDEKKGAFSEFGFINDIKNLDFIQIASVNTLKVEIRVLNEKTSPTREKPPTLIQISEGTVTLSCCHDSLKTIIELVKTFSSSETKSEELMDSPREYDITHMGDINILGNISSNAFSQKPLVSSLSETNYNIQQPQDISNRNSVLFQHLVTDYLPEEQPLEHSKSFEMPIEEVTKLESYDYAVNNIIDSYFPLCITEDDLISRVLSHYYSVPKLELVLSKEIDISIELFGGSDWVEDEDRKRKRSTRDYTKSVRVVLRDAFVQYDSFPVESSFVYRARVSFREIEVLDKLKLSNRNKILTEWKTEEMPHEDGSRMFDLVIESVKPEPNILRSEMRVTMDILPLRVNVHQETLTFLLSFFKTVDTPKPEQEPSTSEDTYFQSFQTSDIMIKADYQPTSVSLSKIKEGEYFQLLNLTPINGLEVRLNGLDIHGQSGVSDLVNAITMAIIPQVTGTQIFRFLLGIMPIKSLYNVGSGVMDLVVLPIQQYNHDGQILRGIRRGVTSFVSNIGVESVNLTANTFQLGSYALGSVGSLFSNEDNSDTEAPETPVPSNINDGLQKAYNEIERGLSNAKCAIVAVPRDYERLGTTGAAGSAFKAILYAPTRVVQSTTEALTHVLYGVRGELDPKSKEENPNLYK